MRSCDVRTWLSFLYKVGFLGRGREKGLLLLLLELKLLEYSHWLLRVYVKILLGLVKKQLKCYISRKKSCIVNLILRAYNNIISWKDGLPSLGKLGSGRRSHSF